MSVMNMIAYIHVCISISLSLHANTPTTTALSVHTYKHTSTCCSHPRSTLQKQAAIGRRVGGACCSGRKEGERSFGLPHMSRRHAVGLPSSHAQPETMKISPHSDTSAVKKNIRSGSHHILDKKLQAITTNRVL